jgi:cytochrome c oxidase subunit III
VSAIVQIEPPRARLKSLPIDQQRGLGGVWCVIATEAMLFVSLFAAYYYLGSNKDRWSMHEPPELKFPLIMLVVLLTSSVVLHWGEQRAREENFVAARLAVWATVLLGLGFLTIQGFEYYWNWSDLAPYSDSYGSSFYAITTLHAAHVMAGLGMLACVGLMPRYGRTQRSPHKPYEAVSRYWHFVDVVWIFIVTFLYVIPHFQRMNHVH